MATQDLFRDFLARAGRLPGDINVRLNQVATESMPPGSTYVGQIGDVSVYTNPAMRRGEGSQHGRNIVVSPDFDMASIGHEIEHVRQARRWGPLLPIIAYAHDVRLRRPGGGIPYVDNPFEKAAFAAQQRTEQAFQPRQRVLPGRRATRGR